MLESWPRAKGLEERLGGEVHSGIDIAGPVKDIVEDAFVVFFVQAGEIRARVVGRIRHEFTIACPEMPLALEVPPPPLRTFLVLSRELLQSARSTGVLAIGSEPVFI